MKTLSFTLDGHDYFIENANDDQGAPRHGDHITDSDGELVCWVTHDDEYFIAEDNDTYCRVHENEPDAAWSAVKAQIAGQY